MNTIPSIKPTFRVLLRALLVTVALGACTPVQGVRDPRPVPVTVSTGPAPSPRGAAVTAEESVREVRGVWVVRTTLTSPEAVRKMVRSTHEAGFNTLLVQVRGRADAYYRSAFEAPPAALAGAPNGFDPLALVLEEAHARGMEVHAWVVAQLVWGVGPLPEDPAHMVRLHPDWLAVPEALSEELYDLNPFNPRYVERLHAWAVDNRERVEGLFASPSHPDARRHLVSVVDDLLRGYRLDGIHLDYVRYPSPEFDYSRRTLKDFRDFALAHVPPGRRASMDARVASGDVTAWAREHRELWDSFRETQITNTLRAVRQVVEDAVGDPILTAAVFADPVDALHGRFQDWQEWLNGGWVDAVAPMAYTDDDRTFADLIESARRADEVGEGRRVWAGVGIYRTDLDGAVRKVDLARAVGTGGFVLFSYDWATTEGTAAEGEDYLSALGRRAIRQSDPGRRP